MRRTTFLFEAMLRILTQMIQEHDIIA